MKNLLDYFAVNWEATSDNIRGYIKIKEVSVQALADAMFRTKRTIDNWRTGKNNPSIDELIFLSKFFNVDLFDLVVTNGQMEGPLSKNDYEEAEKKAKERHEQENIDGEDTEYRFKCREDIISDMCFNEYTKSAYPATNLYEFLLILPLIEPEILNDVLGHILGNTQKNDKYIFKQLERLYNSIEDEKAKAHIEFLRRFCFQYPSINTIEDGTKLKSKLEKFQEYKKMIETEDFIENCQAYEKQANVFREKLNLLSELKNRMKSL